MPLPENVAIKLDLYTLAGRELLNRLPNLHAATQSDTRLDYEMCWRRFDEVLHNFFERSSARNRAQAAEQLANLLSAQAGLFRDLNENAALIFDDIAAAIRSNIEVQSALQEQALIQYEAAVLTALEDVENALVAYAKEQHRRASLGEATQAAENAVDLAQSQYLSGLIDFNNVLTAQRSLLSLQEQLAVSDAEVTSNLITLYKALGGGWSSLATDEKK